MKELESSKTPAFNELGIDDPTDLKSKIPVPTPAEPKIKNATDIVDLIMHDHTKLKANIAILLDKTGLLVDRKAAFLEFTKALEAHAEAEESALYDVMAEEKNMKTLAIKGRSEHQAAATLLEELKLLDPFGEDWVNRVARLAGIVKDHIRVEEDDVLGKVRRQYPNEIRNQMGEAYLEFQDSRIITPEAVEPTYRSQR